MSSTAHRLSLAPAPWKSAFLSSVNSMPSPEFVLATLQPTSSSSSSSLSSSSSAPTPYLPRARFCIFRGMWGELPENKHNTAPQNGRAYTSELLTFTTDVRMQKVGQLFATSAGHATSDDQVQGCGGGGPVEAVFWAKDRSLQWRVKGSAWVVAEDVEGGGEGGASGTGSQESSGVRTLKSEVGERMRVVDEAKTADWSWLTELVAHFGNCSPGMRGSWKNPPPGTPADKEPDEDHKLGQKVDNLDDKIARSNFRVVIIKPDEVESVDLSDPETGRRHSYKFVTENGEGKWTTEVQWP